jgi:hypothetical protein
MGSSSSERNQTVQIFHVLPPLTGYESCVWPSSEPSSPPVDKLKRAAGSLRLSTNRRFQIALFICDIHIFKMAGWMQTSWDASSFLRPLSTCSGWRLSKSVSLLEDIWRSQEMPGKQKNLINLSLKSVNFQWTENS